MVTTTTPEQWPFSLPIFRRSHRATSPDGRVVAEILAANEVSMSNPTLGTLRLSFGLVIENCNPSFAWSDDSRYLAVPQFVRRLLLLRKQRMLIIDVEERIVMASLVTAYYFQPESFSKGLLTVLREPFGSAVRQSWQFPAAASSSFRRIDAVWP